MKKFELGSYVKYGADCCRIVAWREGIYYIESNKGIQFADIKKLGDFESLPIKDNTLVIGVTEDKISSIIPKYKLGDYVEISGLKRRVLGWDCYSDYYYLEKNGEGLLIDNCKCLTELDNVDTSAIDCLHSSQLNFVKNENDSKFKIGDVIYYGNVNYTITELDGKKCKLSGNFNAVVETYTDFIKPYDGKYRIYEEVWHEGIKRTVIGYDGVNYYIDGGTDVVPHDAYGVGVENCQKVSADNITDIAPKFKDVAIFNGRRINIEKCFFEKNTWFYLANKVIYYEGELSEEVESKLQLGEYIYCMGRSCCIIGNDGKNYYISYPDGKHIGNADGFEQIKLLPIVNKDYKYQIVNIEEFNKAQEIKVRSLVWRQMADGSLVKDYVAGYDACGLKLHSGLIIGLKSLLLSEPKFKIGDSVLFGGGRGEITAVFIKQGKLTCMVDGYECYADDLLRYQDAEEPEVSTSEELKIGQNVWFCLGGKVVQDKIGKIFNNAVVELACLSEINKSNLTIGKSNILTSAPKFKKGDYALINGAPAEILDIFILDGKEWCHINDMTSIEATKLEKCGKFPIGSEVWHEGIKHKVTSYDEKGMYLLTSDEPSKLAKTFVVDNQTGDEIKSCLENIYMCHELNLSAEAPKKYDGKFALGEIVKIEVDGRLDYQVVGYCSKDKSYILVGNDGGIDFSKFTSGAMGNDKIPDFKLDNVDRKCGWIAENCIQKSYPKNAKFQLGEICLFQGKEYKIVGYCSDSKKYLVLDDAPTVFGSSLQTFIDGISSDKLPVRPDFYLDRHKDDYCQIGSEDILQKKPLPYPIGAKFQLGEIVYDNTSSESKIIGYCSKNNNYILEAVDSCYTLKDFLDGKLPTVPDFILEDSKDKHCVSINEIFLFPKYTTEKAKFTLNDIVEYQGEKYEIKAYNSFYNLYIISNSKEKLKAYEWELSLAKTKQERYPEDTKFQLGQEVWVHGIKQKIIGYTKQGYYLLEGNNDITMQCEFLLDGYDGTKGFVPHKFRILSFDPKFKLGDKVIYNGMEYKLVDIYRSPRSTNTYCSIDGATVEAGILIDKISAVKMNTADDAIDACYRIAAKQLVDLIKKMILTQCVGGVKEILDTDVFRSIIGFVIGHTLKEVNDFRVQRLAKEFRVAGMMVLEEAVVDTMIKLITEPERKEIIIEQIEIPANQHDNS